MQLQPQQLNIPNRLKGRGLQTAGNDPRFGRLGDKLANIFQPITEQFVYGFTAQDVVALWVPRDATALTRSRDAYDVAQDPAMRGKHPLKQWFYSIYRNVKGLNYSNAWEETLREVETGPGLLIAQSVLMGGAAAGLVGKLSLMMGYGDLQAYSNAFGQMLKSSSAARGFKTYQHDALKLEKYLQDSFLTRLFKQGHFKSGLNQALPVEVIRKAIKPTDVADGNLALFNLIKSARNGRSLQGVTYGEVLDKWIGKWTAINPNGPKAVYLKQIDSLEAALKRLTYWFNDSVKGITNPALVNQLEISALGHHPHGVEHVVENLRKFRPFISQVHELGIQNAVKSSPGSRVSTLISGMSAATTKLFKGVAVRKTALSLAATVLAGWVVVTVSAIAQRGKAYPANKKFMFAHNTQGQQAGHGAPHFQGAQVQQSSFSRQSSQPAHSVEPAAVSFGGAK